MRSQDHFVNSRFFAEGHLDDQLFLHYDSERGRAEARALWAETVLGAETWDSETQDLAGSGKNLRMTLADINTLQEQKGVSPIVTVTCSEALEDTINVTCVAFGFYPQNISLTWLQNGEPLSQETQQSVGVLPYGNGTYQTWVSTRIPQGQELSFSCRARHTGKDSTVTVPCGELWHPSRASQPGLRSSQVLDHQQMVTRNHKGTKQLGSTFQGDAVGSIRPEDLEPLCDEAELEGHNSR
ncbi:MHC class I polypeptide-related sequence A [Sciurus carolinensis]|uniref:MHC class I polypeptide-related sequence A n=1 Tax=Sciurus carolinensis TaxID=30640 RepID=A0AA41SUG7_SCICA|nr:MHC class I polypeptide-related sequence A [Sciurus carolinensis]